MKNKTFFLTLLSLLLMVFLAGCATAENNSYKSITADEAHQMMMDEKVVILDVRTADEYKDGHIKDAILIANESITDTPPALLPMKDAKILVYCRSGNRSKQASQKLFDMGYTNVYEFGGINDWTYETEQGAFELEEKQSALNSFYTWDLDGRLVDESIFKDNKLTMINLWGTFCGPCLSEMPDLGELNRENKEKGLQIVGIITDMQFSKDNTFDSNIVSTAKELREMTKADYLHLTPSYDLYYAKLQYVSGIPETIFVDSEGNLVGKSYMGARSKDAWQKIIDETLLLVD